MKKAPAVNVAANAISAVSEGITYDQMDCQGFVEEMVRRAGGNMDYAGSNAMARAVTWLGTLANAKADGKLVKGSLLFIHEETEAGLPAQYRGDGLGDFSHVGIYVGEKALYDTDKNGNKRLCNVVHSGKTLYRVAGSTLQNGWTHVGWMPEIDYGVEVQPGVSIGAEIATSDAESAKAETAGLRYAIVTAPSGSTVNMRPQPTKRGKLYWAVSVNTRVSVERAANGWALINAVCVDGVPRRAWMMEKYLEYEG